jgi:osmotically inducible lipoprotein OsmB
MKKELLLTGAILAGLGFGLAGCSSAPGTPGQQGAVVGGATGAAVGASVTKNRALGAVIGGAVGAAGGYVVGNKTGPLDKKDNTTTTYPDGTVQTTTMQTADLNHDGYVTLDEIVSMEKSGVSDDEMVRRIQATGLTFDLNDEQRKYLSDHGVSQTVINQLPLLNRATTTTTTTIPAPQGSTVISR